MRVLRRQLRARLKRRRKGLEICEKGMKMKLGDEGKERVKERV